MTELVHRWIAPRTVACGISWTDELRNAASPELVTCSDCLMGRRYREQVPHCHHCEHFDQILDQLGAVMAAQDDINAAVQAIQAAAVSLHADAAAIAAAQASSAVDTNELAAAVNDLAAAANAVNALTTS